MLRKDLLGLADQLKNVSTDDVAFATVPLADVDYKTPTGESAVLWDKTGAKELFRGSPPTRRSPSPPTPRADAHPAPAASPSTTPLTVPPARIAVRVLNGTMITGLGAQTKPTCRRSDSLSPRPPATPR